VAKPHLCTQLCHLIHWPYRGETTPRQIAGWRRPYDFGSWQSAMEAHALATHETNASRRLGHGPVKPRTVVTTDPELDDLNSMLRLLLYSNEIDIVGLVYSASQFHYRGDPGRGGPAPRSRRRPRPPQTGGRADARGGGPTPARSAVPGG
jgi:hypothetical protein